MGILDRFRLDGRVALVTAGSGPQFGSSLTEGLAEAGATVISASRSLERNQQFAAKTSYFSSSARSGNSLSGYCRRAACRRFTMRENLMAVQRVWPPGFDLAAPSRTGRL